MYHGPYSVGSRVGAIFLLVLCFRRVLTSALCIS
nr:MAG TPA: hypothetical protein [Caudoviricetes sp.]